MNKDRAPIIIAAAIAAIVLAGVLIFWGVAGGPSAGPTDLGAKLPGILERSGGDVSKMTAEEKKVYDEAVRTGYYRPEMSGPAAASGGSGSGGGAYRGSSGGAGSYPGASARPATPR